jgi:hypothetical protein
LPALQNGFVNLDDDKNFLSNPDFRGLGWASLSRCDAHSFNYAMRHGLNQALAPKKKDPRQP